MNGIFAAALAASFFMIAPAVRADVGSGVDAWHRGDYARAVEEWRPLAQAGNADAQFNLGQAYKLGRGVPANLSSALEWFRKASQQGHEKAIDTLGLLLFQQGHREEALPFLRASAARGEPRAQYVYGSLLFNGDLTPRDWVRAYALMTRASQAGVQQASASLAQMDLYVPAEQRTEGLALAATMAQGGDAAALPPAFAAAPAPIMAQARAEPEPPAHQSDPAPRSLPASLSRPIAPPAPSGRYHVQLGAFRENGRAEALWKALNGRLPMLADYRPTYLATNGLTRLLVGPLDSAADARTLCARIRPTGTPCIVQGN